jgi:hypothetical protein
MVKEGKRLEQKTWRKTARKKNKNSGNFELRIERLTVLVTT